MNNLGIKIYDNIIRNKYVYFEISPEAVFSFADGARVDFISRDPNILCDVVMFEKETMEIHYQTTLHGGTFAKSNRSEISPLIIKATDTNGNILLDIDLEEWAKEIL